MSNRAQIGVASSESGFEMWVYLHWGGERVEEIVAGALKKCLTYKPGDPQSVMVFIVAELTRQLGCESIFLSPLREDHCYRTVVIYCDTQTVTYESVYKDDPDYSVDSYEDFGRVYLERLAAAVLEDEEDAKPDGLGVMGYPLMQPADWGLHTEG